MPVIETSLPEEGDEAGVGGVAGVRGLAHADVVVVGQHHELAIPGRMAKETGG